MVVVVTVDPGGGGAGTFCLVVVDSSVVVVRTVGGVEQAPIKAVPPSRRVAGNIRHAAALAGIVVA